MSIQMEAFSLLLGLVALCHRPQHDGHRRGVRWAAGPDAAGLRGPAAGVGVGRRHLHAGGGVVVAELDLLAAATGEVGEVG